jgi:hypothetical protein
MSRLAYVLGAIGNMVRARPTPRECEIDRPASFAEIVAASAFLDFGGMPSGDWLHAWEASVDADRRPKGEDLPAANVLPPGARKQMHRQRRAPGKNCLSSAPAKACSKRICRPRSFSLSLSSPRTYAFSRQIGWTFSYAYRQRVRRTRTHDVRRSVRLHRRPDRVRASRLADEQHVERDHNASYGDGADRDHADAARTHAMTR